MFESEVFSNLHPYAVGAIKVSIIVGIGFLAMYLVRLLVPKAIMARIGKIRKEPAEQLASRSKTISTVVVQLAIIIIWMIAGITALSAVGVNIYPILAGIGVAGLAIGLAAQNIIRDYLHGFFIIAEDWYRVGEVAKVAGIPGLVENITLRRTILRDINGTVHIIPHNKVDLASNLTRDWARVNLNVSVAYKENLDKVVSVINEVGNELKEDPQWGVDLLTAPQVLGVDNLGDNGIDIKILADTKPIRQWALTRELRKRLKDRFDKEDIEIPWPHTKVYFGNAPTESGTN